MTLTKQDLIIDVSKNLQVFKNNSAGWIETLLELMIFTLASGEDIRSAGSGSFMCLIRIPGEGAIPLLD